MAFVTYLGPTPKLPYTIPEKITKEMTKVTLTKSPTLVDSTSLFYKIEGKKQPNSPYIASLKGSDENLKIGDVITFENDNTAPKFRITGLEVVVINGITYTNIFYQNTEDSEKLISAPKEAPIYRVDATKSATAEASYKKLLDAYNFLEYEKGDHTIPNYSAFDEIKDSKPFIHSDAKLKFFAKTPGSWGNAIDVAIAKPEDFNKGKFIAPGIPLDNQFDYIPYGSQFAIIVMFKNQIVEQFIVSFDELAKNDKNEFIYIETAINQKSDYILVNVNKNLEDTITSCLLTLDSNNNYVVGEFDNDIVKLTNGTLSNPQKDDIEDAYSIFDNKEEIDVDIIIANELHPAAAINLALHRRDCIAYVGAPKSNSVGFKSSIANENTIKWRRSLNVDSKYIALYNNYKYQYCAKLGTYKWINLAGDVAGIKAQTNQDYANWYAPAGLNRGNIKNCSKLAYSPTNAMRDTLYKNGVNPIVIFPNTGAVIWGQKTAQTKASSFDRINVVSLFNHLERSLGNMSKYSLFEFNDSFTRNQLVSTIKPFLAEIKAGRGIQNYQIICDETNNTPQIIATNWLVCDIFIQPTYVAEFIHLRFTNFGTNNFEVTTSK